MKALIRDALLNGWDFSFFLNHFPLFCLTVFLYITIIIIYISTIIIISNFFSMIFYKFFSSFLLTLVVSEYLETEVNNFFLKFMRFYHEQNNTWVHIRSA